MFCTVRSSLLRSTYLRPRFCTDSVTHHPGSNFWTHAPPFSGGAQFCALLRRHNRAARRCCRIVRDIVSPGTEWSEHVKPPGFALAKMANVTEFYDIGGEVRDSVLVVGALEVEITVSPVCQEPEVVVYPVLYVD